MGALNLELFTKAGHDLESSQYRILAGIASVRSDFHHSRLYPTLPDLIELASILETIRQQGDHYRRNLPKTITGVDLETKTLMLDAVPADQEAVEHLFTLIMWALPSLKLLVEEGTAMFDFVSQHMSLDIVGIMPIYKDEGYVMIPDLRTQIFHILRYELSLFTAEQEQYRAMRTIEVETRDVRHVQEAPESIKLELVRGHRDLPNPATYICDTDLDFPFEETILPVAKRKLMRHLIS